MQAVSAMPQRWRGGLQWAFQRADIGQVAFGHGDQDAGELNQPFQYQMPIRAMTMAAL